MTGIREVKKSDRNAILSIIKKSDNLTESEKKCAVELLDIHLGRADDKDYLHLVYTSGGDALGYLCYGFNPLTDGVYDVYWIIVAHEKRGRGIGKSLMDYLEGVLKKSGARMITIETSSVKSFESARRLYSRCGFRDEARVKDFYKAGDDKIIYVKNL